MLTDDQVLSLVYQKQAAGDTRDLATIAAAVRADDAALNPAPAAPAPTAQVGQGVRVDRDGTVYDVVILANGTIQESPRALSPDDQGQ